MLGTAINGAVSSPVSGGVPLYRDTFVDSSFRSDRPEFAGEVQALQDALEAYGQCVLKALKVHEKVCKDIAFHEALKSRMSMLHVQAYPQGSGESCVSLTRRL